MGAFFSNVQVRADHTGFEKIVAALRADAESREMFEVDEGGEADRTVVIVPPAGADGYVSVYDEATESQETSALDALATLVSQAAASTALSVLVHDSDVLVLGLFARGERKDRYDSHAKVSPKKRKERDFGVWAPLLVAAATAHDLGAAFDAQDLFAEATLATICKLIGCDPTRASTGQRYLARGAALPPAGTVTLRLRLRNRPAYEAVPQGTPHFEAYVPYDVATCALSESDALRLGFAVKNAGGASKGLTLTVWGSAVDDGLVEVERFETLFGNVLEGAKHVTYTPERRLSKAGETLLVLDLPAQELAAGVAMTGFTPGMDVRKMMSASMRSMVHFNVVGRVLRAGSGALFGGFVPHAASEGAHAAQYALRVDPKLAQPLRYAVDEARPASSSHLLRPLSSETYLVAMACIDGPRANASGVAARALDRMLEIMGTGGHASTAIFRKPGDGVALRPTSGAGKVTSLLRGKRRDTLVAAMGDEASVEVTVRDGAAFDPETGPNRGAWGLSFGASVLGDRDEARVNALTVWLNADAAGEARTRVVRTMLVALLDDIMRDEGVQATLFRCGAYTSAYEDACGISHEVRTARSYVRRWLRVPGNDTLWLGPSLVANLAATAASAIEAVAKLETRGPATRITLDNPRHAAALEQALASLLPTATDAREATVALYTHP